MSEDAGKYGEPWALSGQGEIVHRGGHRLPRSGFKARIVACVNACAGADAPQPGELARLRDVEADYGALMAENARLMEQVARWEQKEVERGSHCTDIEAARDAALAEVERRKEAHEGCLHSYQRVVDQRVVAEEQRDAALAEVERLKLQIECDKRDPAHENCRNGVAQVERQRDLAEAEVERLKSEGSILRSRVIQMESVATVQEMALKAAAGDIDQITASQARVSAELAAERERSIRLEHEAVQLTNRLTLAEGGGTGMQLLATERSAHAETRAKLALAAELLGRYHSEWGCLSNEAGDRCAEHDPHGLEACEALAFLATDTSTGRAVALALEASQDRLRAEKAEAKLAEAEHARYSGLPHMCRDGHQEIHHGVEAELCPVCEVVAKLARAVELLAAQRCPFCAYQYGTRLTPTPYAGCAQHCEGGKVRAFLAEQEQPTA